MSKKLQNIHLAIIPMMFLITIIFSVVMFIVKKDSQNWYSLFGQCVLVAVYIFANLGFKRLLKNRTLAIVLANVIFQLLLFAHIVLYIFTEILLQAINFEYVEYLCYGYVFISFVAIVIMLYDLVACVTQDNLFKNEINLETEKVNKLNKIFLATMPALIAWSLLYSLIMLSFDIMHIVFNGLALVLLIAIWIGMNTLVGKHLKNKRLALIISQIIVQVILWVFIICNIVLALLPLSNAYTTAIISYSYQCISLFMISIFTLVAMFLQLKIQNIPTNKVALPA